jgi:hypothetical protein
MCVSSARAPRRSDQPTQEMTSHGTRSILSDSRAKSREHSPGQAMVRRRLGALLGADMATRRGLMRTEADSRVSRAT